MKTMTQKLVRSFALTLLMAAVAVVGWQASTSAQATFSSTTLALNVVDSQITTVQVSAAGSIARDWVLYVDREVMLVTSISGTVVQVVRGASGTKAAPHLKGGVVWAGPGRYFVGSDPYGACTADQTQVQPVINVASGNISQCVNGKWQQSSLNPQAFNTFPRRDIIGTGAYTAALTDVLIAYTSLTASSTVTLPSTSGLNGHWVIIKDESGLATSSLFISVAPQSGYTIDGGSGSSIRNGYGVLRFYSSGTAWFSW